jgi:hypothetical protein
MIASGLGIMSSPIKKYLVKTQVETEQRIIDCSYCGAINNLDWRSQDGSEVKILLCYECWRMESCPCCSYVNGGGVCPTCRD